MLREICRQPTDDDIRQMLTQPPTTLTDLYCQILSHIAADGRSNLAINCFKFVAVARRPLTILELQEAMAVEPYARASQPGRFINNISQIFAWFGGLLAREEINNEVRFAHSTILQALLDQYKIGSQLWAYIDADKVSKEVGIVCVTYLHFDDFKTQLVKRSALQGMDSLSVLDTAVQRSTPLLAKLARHKLVRRSLSARVTLGVAGQSLNVAYKPVNDVATSYANDFSSEHHPFLNYASINWLPHSRGFSNLDRIWPLWKALLSHENKLAKRPSGFSLEGANEVEIEIERHEHSALLLWDRTGRALLRDHHVRDLVSRMYKAQAFSFFKCVLQDWLELNLDFKAQFQILYGFVATKDIDRISMVLESQLPESIMTAARDFRISGAKPQPLDIPRQLVVILIVVAAAIVQDTERIGRLVAIATLDDSTSLEGDVFHHSRGRSPSLAAALVSPRTVQFFAGLTFGEDFLSWHDGCVILHSAVTSGETETIAVLLSLGIDVNAVQHGRTALQDAIQSGQHQIINLLLSAGANVNAKDNFRAAINTGHVEIVSKLLSAGASVDAFPALAVAAEQGHANIVELLLSAGSKVNQLQRATNGWSRDRTAIQCAAEEGHLGVIEVLLAAGAHVGHADQEWNMARLAERNGHTVAAARLDTAVRASGSSADCASCKAEKSHEKRETTRSFAF
jgi:ankyrin repeat protein